MTDHIYEIALERALDYLTRCSVEITPAVLDVILHVIRQAARQGEKGFLARVMDDLPNRFALRLPSPQPPSPPIKRRSMGYG